MTASARVANARLLLAVCALALLPRAAALIDAAGGVIRAAPQDFWSPSCSAVGVSIAFSSAFSLLFYLGLLTVIVALLAGSYHACFRLFAKEMFRYDW